MASGKLVSSVRKKFVATPPFTARRRRPGAPQPPTRQGNSPNDTTRTTGATPVLAPASSMVASTPSATGSTPTQPSRDRKRHAPDTHAPALPQPKKHKVSILPRSIWYSVKGDSVRAEWKGEFHPATISLVIKHHSLYEVRYDTYTDRNGAENVSKLVEWHDVHRPFELLKPPVFGNEGQRRAYNASSSVINAGMKVLAMKDNGTGKGCWYSAKVEKLEREDLGKLERKHIDPMHTKSSGMYDENGDPVYPVPKVVVPTPATAENEDAAFEPLPPPASNDYNLSGARVNRSRVVGRKPDGGYDFRTSRMWEDITTLEQMKHDVKKFTGNKVRHLAAQPDHEDGDLNADTDAEILISWTGTDRAPVQVAVADTKTVWWQLDISRGVYYEVELKDVEKMMFSMSTDLVHTARTLGKIMRAKLEAVQ